MPLRPGLCPDSLSFFHVDLGAAEQRRDGKDRKKDKKRRDKWEGERTVGAEKREKQQGEEKGGNEGSPPLLGPSLHNARFATVPHM